MNKFILFPLLILCILVANCSKSDYQNVADQFNKNLLKTTTNTPINLSNAPINPSFEPKLVNQKIIKNGIINFEVSNLEDTNKKIKQIIKKYNAYTISDNQFETQDKKTNSIIIKMPNDYFDKLLNDIKILTKNIEYQNITINDVSQQYFDAQTRLKNKQQLEERYLQIIKKANKVSDLLEIENNLNNVRIDIENLTEDIKNLDNKINFSTLNTTFYIKKNKTIKYTYDFNQALHQSWENFIKLLLFIIKNLPYILLTIIIITLIIRKIKK